MTTTITLNDLDNRLTTVESALDAGKQIVNLPIKEIPQNADIANIQTDSGENYNLPLKFLINNIYVLPATENLAAGNLVNIWNDGGVAKIRLADAGTNKSADAFVLKDTGIGTGANVHFAGVNDKLTLLTPGESYFLSETPGGITTTPPTSGAGKISQYIGKAVSATEIMFMPTQQIELS